jgi:hypothetical protein
MQNISYYAAAAAFIGAVIVLVLYHAAVVRRALASTRAALAVHDEILGGGAGAASGRLAELEARLAGLGNEQGRVAARLSELDVLARTDLSQVGFVRYDAFDDTGSDLSYAMALLSREGDGVVLSSIYSREDTRTYGKAVEKFQPRVHASDEELLAIARARGARDAR